MNEKREPLTLEQLREIVGMPVWIERNDPPHDGKWDLVDHADIENADKTLYTKSGVTYSEYGKYFTAYVSAPPRLDRSAWEPCELCGRIREADPCYKDGCFRKNAPQCDYRCDKFLKWRDAQRKLRNSKFCPKCGRPLIPELRARAEAAEKKAEEGSPAARGRWRFVGQDSWNDYYECSTCGKMNADDSNFCPNCGADMRGGDQQ